MTFHVLDVSHEAPDVTPCRTSLPMRFSFARVSRETPDVTPCHTSRPLQGASMDGPACPLVLHLGLQIAVISRGGHVLVGFE